MNTINFTSRIRPVTPAEFNRIANTMTRAQYVDYPWTLKESICSDKAFTKSVADCTVCGVTDGLKVLLIHLSPTNIFNFNKDKIKDLIESHFDIKNPNLQGVLIGGKPEYTHGPDSYRLFEIFEKLLNSYQIPFSKLKGGMGSKDVAYSSQTDEWIIANNRVERPRFGEIVSPRKELEKIFNEVNISEMDQVSW